MSAFRNYSPKNVILNVGANPTKISGYSKGSFIEADRSVDTFKLFVGADGEATRVQSLDSSGMIKVMLDQGSASNAYFTALWAADVASGAGVVPVTLRYVGGITIVSSLQGWIVKPANIKFAEDSQVREWGIALASAAWSVG